ncbi:tudor domain-containing protein 7-like [Antedon mediterranea]|uniref:tudor domain-containing protein 7-like n=1 Tax=Antedon mediterranea TaxID=105859 RepID=UPI003AF8861A
MPTMAQPEDVKKLLRSLLISQKGGVPLQLLASDYRSLIGDHIPYTRFGFRSLEEYLQSIPDVVRIQRGAEGYICCPVADAASAHVHSLVSRQRTQKKKKTRRPVRASFINFKKSPTKRHFGPQSATKSFAPKIYPQSNGRQVRGNVQPQLSVPRNGPSGPSLRPIKTQTPVASGLPPRLQRRLGHRVTTHQSSAKSSSKTVAISNLPASFGPDLIKKHFASMNPVEASLDAARGCVVMKFANASASDVKEKFDGSLFIGREGSSNICVTVEPDLESQGKDELSILERIQKIIGEKPHGFWLKDLGSEYKRVYCETFPDISLDDMESVVKVERLHSSVILYPKMKVTIHGKGQVQRTITKEIPKVSIPPPVLKPVKSRVVVYVTYVLSCGEFFVQYEDSPIVELAERLFNQCESCSQPMSRYSRGEFCAAKYSEDGNWCRAKILEVNQQPNKDQEEIQVFFIDYGNQESLRQTSLQFLTPQFGKEPAQAIKCSLSEITPLKGDKRFSSEANSRFRELTKDTPLLMTVEDIINDKCVVNLLTSEDVDIVEELCKESLVHGMYPPPLVYPEESPWEVTISYNLGINDFFFQFYHYTEEFEAMEAELNQFYSRQPNAVEGQPKIGQSYAVCTENCFFRVVVSGFSNNKVMCDYVDYGDKEVRDWSQFRSLDKRFLTLPFQAVKCSLANLGQFSNNKRVIDAFIEQTEDKIVLAEEAGKSGSRLEVVLYDAECTGESINTFLASVVEDDNLKQQCPEVGKKIEVYVSHVEDNGVLNIQIPGPGLERLESLMVNMGEHFSKPSSAEEFLVEPKFGKKCCAKFSQDQTWYRAEITKVVSNTQVSIKYVDYGNTEVVSMTSLREPKVNIPSLRTLPPQSLPCILEGVPPNQLGYKWGKYASQWLFDMLENQLVQIEVVRGKTDQRPATVLLVIDNIVMNDQMLELADELFLDNKQASTDDKVSMDNGISKDKNINGSETVQDIVKDMMNFSITPTQLRRPSTDLKGRSSPELLLKMLPMPPSLDIPAPADDAYWDVVVVSAKDPSHFVCRPFVSSKSFNDMLFQMKEHYSNTSKETPVGEIQVGEIYAVYSNDKWQRAKVYTMNEHSVNVYRVDEADYDIVSPSDVRILIQQFRTLPFQGVIARLDGVVPLDNAKFHSDGAASFFQNIVKGKTFVSTIKEKIEESFHIFKLVVELTNTEHPLYDIVISEYLIESGVVLKL